ncbi:MAG: 30S ribosomal protein S17 [Dehalococcoidia bacterium]|nr:30S ribosomal protein S17 [Dehalococcoidia bacterium]
MTQAAAGVRAVNRKARVGTVVSDKGDQTIIVSIERASQHRLYHKVIRHTKRYPVHDPENLATLGDTVRIEECRPISKTKRWRLVEVLQERAVAQVEPTSIDAMLVSDVQRAASRAQDEAAAASAAAGAAEASSEAQAAPAAPDEQAST